MSNRFEYVLWIFAFFLVGFAFFFGLFIDLTGDSALYAAISRQMVESGDWFNLKINGVPYDQKPHLFFWLAGIGIKWFGNTNFAFKLFPFLYGFLGIYFTYRLGKQMYNEKAGKIAALVTGTSQMVFLYFFDFHTDSVLQTGVVFALWQLAAYIQHKKTMNFVFGFFGVGLAMLAKGPVGAVLPFFSVLLFLLVQKDYKQMIHPKWILGAIIAFAVVSPTLLHLYKSFGFQGLKFFFITNNFGRITGDYAGSSNDYFYYLYNALWAFLPWTFLVIFGIYYEIKYWFKAKNIEANGIYLLGSVLILLIILSIAKGKAPNYFLIAVAPVSVLAAKRIAILLADTDKKSKNFIRIQVVFAGTVAIGFFIIYTLLSFITMWVAIVSIVLSVFVIFYFLREKKQTLKKALLISLIFAGSLNLILNSVILPELFSYQGAGQALKIFNEQQRADSKFYQFETEGYELFFYSVEKITHIGDWDELRTAMNKSDTWLYTNDIKYKDILKMNFNIDTIYEIRQRGMNRINFEFLNPSTRESSLKSNYLIVTSRK